MTNRSPSRRPGPSIVRTVCAILAAGVLLGLVPAAPGSAAPIDDERAKAQQLEASLNDTGEQLAALYEQIKYNREQVDQAQATIASTGVAIASAQANVDRIKGIVRERAVTIYQRSGHTGLDELQTDVREISARRKYAEVTSVRDDGLLDQLAKAKDQLAAKRDAAESARQDAEDRTNTLQQQQSTFEATQAQQQRLLAQVQGDIARLVAEEAAKRAAAEAPKNVPAAVTPAATGTPTSGTPATGAPTGTPPVAGTTPDVGTGTPAPSPSAGTPDPTPAPPTSGGAPAVVAYAAAQLGKPYCYAGSGPSCFDCSGLTMMAWAQAGVYLPHNSESQYASFKKVSMNALQPGDIVWSPGHVGIYVGGGAVIHAPHTGDVVRYIDVGYFQGAVRPG